MYRGRLERDLSIWVDKGLITEVAAEQMLGEYDARPASFSLGRVLMVLAAVLLGAAVLLLIASNWEAIPRLVRVGAILIVIWAAYLGAAALFARGAQAAGNALLVIAVLGFGGAISLIGQMYHLSGDEQVVMYLWFAIAVISAALFRSASAFASASALSCFAFAIAGASSLSLSAAAFPLVDVGSVAIAALQAVSAVKKSDFASAWTQFA